MGRVLGEFPEVESGLEFGRGIERLCRSEACSFYVGLCYDWDGSENRPRNGMVPNGWSRMKNIKDGPLGRRVGTEAVSVPRVWRQPMGLQRPLLKADQTHAGGNLRQFGRCRVGCFRRGRRHLGFLLRAFGSTEQQSVIVDGRERRGRTGGRVFRG